MCYASARLSFHYVSYSCAESSSGSDDEEGNVYRLEEIGNDDPLSDDGRVKANVFSVTSATSRHCFQNGRLSRFRKLKAMC